MKQVKLFFWSLILWISAGASCLAQPKISGERIVSLNGAISEILCALGMEQQIVGVDITSTFPAALKGKPQVGHNRNISAEGILALNPTLVLGLKEQLTPQLQNQLRSGGVRTVLHERVYSADGVRRLLQQVAAAVNEKARSAAVLQKFNAQMAALDMRPLGKKVLFIYARGAGTMLVSGAGTAVDAMIKLAGAENAVGGFSDYKPLSAESLVAGNPDVILMFTDGLAGMGGIPGIMKVPGVAQTAAGRNRKIIAMDGELLSGFTLRLPQALRELHQKIATQ